MMGQLQTKKRIGKTNLMVSPLCFGTSGLGNMPDTYGYEVDEKRARETFNAIFEGPVNFLIPRTIMDLEGLKKELVILGSVEAYLKAL